jgi:hypothetical protein
MFNRKEKIKNLIEKLNLNKKENIISFVVAIVVTALFYLDSTLSLGIIWTLLIFSLFIIIAMFMVVTGFIVIKSLLSVSTALILLIFLAQTYCDIPRRTIEGDNALKSLLMIGILYVIFYFSQSLIKSLRNNYKKIEKEKWSSEKMISIILFFLFIGLFVWTIYQIIAPIILNLCIYK